MTDVTLSVPEQHQLKIAKQTLRYSDIGAMVMGGMTKPQARNFLHDVADWSDDRIERYENHPNG
jgi:hypothetical protein